MDALCGMVEDRATWSQDHALLVLVVPAELGWSSTHVVLQRYKHRGSMQAAFAIDAGGKRHSLRIELASALAALGRA
jgi:hypothetical protein